ncbi:nucleotidyltransferase domain-containing protein [Mycoplasmatota bacterium WC44]
MISEKKAFEIIQEFKNDLINKSEKVIGIYAIGSLGGGYYRPGESDIDTIIIVKDDFELDQYEVGDIANNYYEKYNVPKGFGAVVIEESKLYPPYNFNDELVLEILRLKVQGVSIYGNYDLAHIPMPTNKDLIEDARVFEKWCDSEFKGKMFDGISKVGCVNTILIHLKRYLMIELDLIDFNKLKVVSMFKKHSKHEVDHTMLDVVDNFLQGKDICCSDFKTLKDFGSKLRDEFNELLLVNSDD